MAYMFFPHLLNTFTLSLILLNFSQKHSLLPCVLSLTKNITEYEEERFKEVHG